MATGDNILTAIFIAKECEIFTKKASEEIFYGDVQDEQLVWRSYTNHDQIV